jgi:hypothetical protein
MISEHDALTGITVEREPSKQEKEQLEIDLIAEKERQEKEKTKNALKLSALAKLAALGLTEDEIAAL